MKLSAPTPPRPLYSQVAALQEGLGLTTPQPAFWQPMGELTSALSSDDKVWLLADLAPLFASEADSAFLEGAVPVLEKVQARLREAVPEFALEADDDGAVAASLTPKQLEGLQLLSVDLLTVDYLVHGRADLEEPFLEWVRDARMDPSGAEQASSLSLSQVGQHARASWLSGSSTAHELQGRRGRGGGGGRRRAQGRADAADHRREPEPVSARDRRVAEMARRPRRAATAASKRVARLRRPEGR